MTDDKDPILEIRNSRLESVHWLVLSVIFTYGCLLYLKFDPDDFLNSVPDGAKNQDKGWFAFAGLILFGFAILSNVKELLDRRIQIRIDKHGLYLRRGPEQTIPWRDIDDIVTPSGTLHRYAIFLLTASSITVLLKGPRDYKSGLKTLRSGVKKTASGYEIVLSPRGLNISRNNLLDALQSAHHKYAPHANKTELDQPAQKLEKNRLQ